MTTEATPRPWRVIQSVSDKLAIVGPRNDGTRTDADRICNLPHRKRSGFGASEGEANAALIVRAVNERDARQEAWDAMLAALKMVDASTRGLAPDGVVHIDWDAVAAAIELAERQP